MMNIRKGITSRTLFLVIFLYVCASLAACSDDTSKPQNTDTDLSDTRQDRDTSDASDTDDPAPDTADTDDNEDTGPTDCEIDDDCDFGSNQAGVCDEATNTCAYACDRGFGDCNNDPSDGCEVDLSADIGNCGSCGTVCTTDNTHYAPVCLSEASAEPTCAVDPNSCAEGYVDLNGDPNDGCECAITDATDPIDADGEDTNCDGVDGILAETVFVSLAGDDANDGLAPETPVKTIAKGLEVAAGAQRTTVQVAAGTYAEAVELKDGISVYGGYDPDADWSRDLTVETRIEPATGDFEGASTHYRTISATSITSPTFLDNLTIVGADLSSLATSPGASTYGLWAKDSDGVVVQNSVIIGGESADGAAGASGTPGDSASCEVNIGGAPGGQSSETAPCDLPAGSTNAAGGFSGKPSSEGGVGGLGGTHTCIEDRSQCSSAVVDGQNGTNGSAGTVGTDGAPGSNGTGEIVGGLWQAAASAQPTDGTKGTGGGGGGAGANCEDSDAPCLLIFCPDNVDVGGAGGKGGDGGCEGSSGENGQAGGGSFGAFAVASDLTLTNTRIAMGKGGAGGNGGEGGVGASGENGGNRNAGEGYGGVGGLGGNGGKGGDGGNGAGGCGGPSIGLALFESTVEQGTLTIDQATGEVGVPGLGAGSAPDGCAATIAKVQDFSAEE